MIDLNDVLLAMSNIPVDDPIAEIWGRGLQGGYKIIEYTGSLPITIRANGDALIDYRIYGNTENGESVGERTANLFEVESDMLSSLNWNLNSASLGQFFINYKLSDAVTQELKKGQHTCSIFEHFTDGYTPNLLVCAFSPTTTGGVGEGYRILTNNGMKFTRTFDFSEWQNIYLIIGYGNGFITEADKQLKIDELFANWRISIVEGSTAPASYIPYGYKLPMTVYKQEFMVTGDMLDQSNWFLSGLYFIYFNISDLISKEGCVAKIYENFSAGYTPKKLVVALTDRRYSLVDTEYRILNNYGVISNKEFDFSSWDTIYLCIGYGDGFTSDGVIQSKIDELFENWKILIAPTSQTREAPVYIGNTPLGEDEYVSFSDQKIYRNVSGTLTPTDPPVPFPEIPTVDGETVIDYDGDPKPSQMYVKYKGKAVQ